MAVIPPIPAFNWAYTGRLLQLLLQLRRFLPIC